MIELAQHMPFLTLDESGAEVLLHCRAGPATPQRARAWKLWASTAAGSFQIETGLGPEVVECSPAAWRDAEGWHVSFVAGGAASNPLFRLWLMSGPSLDALGPPVFVAAPVSAGYMLRSRLVYVENHNRIRVRDADRTILIESIDATVVRATYRADAENLMLVSLMPRGDAEPMTVEYDLASGSQYELRDAGSPVYKPSIFGERMLHAIRLGDEFEGREIRVAEQVERSPVDGGPCLRRVATLRRK